MATATSFPPGVATCAHSSDRAPHAPSLARLARASGSARQSSISSAFRFFVSSLQTSSESPKVAPGVDGTVEPCSKSQHHRGTTRRCSGARSTFISASRHAEARGDIFARGEAKTCATTMRFPRFARVRAQLSPKHVEHNGHRSAKRRSGAAMRLGAAPSLVARWRRRLCSLGRAARAYLTPGRAFVDTPLPAWVNCPRAALRTLLRRRQPRTPTNCQEGGPMRPASAAPRTRHES